MITEEEIDKAVNYIHQNAKLAAKAKATREFLDDFTKHLESRLARDSGESSVSAREMIARASDEYLEHLKELRAAIEKDEEYRNLMKAAEIIFDKWRTEQSNQRALSKI